MHKLLLIDDDEQLRSCLAEYLCDRGFEVHQAAEPESTEALLQYHSYSVIMTDLSLSTRGGEGFDLLKRMSILDPRPKLLVMSGHGSSEYRLIAQQCGADLFLHKPFSLATLGKLVGQCVADVQSEPNQCMHVGSRRTYCSPSRAAGTMEG